METASPLTHSLIKQVSTQHFSSWCPKYFLIQFSWAYPFLPSWWQLWLPCFLSWNVPHSLWNLASSVMLFCLKIVKWLVNLASAMKPSSSSSRYSRKIQHNSSPRLIFNQKDPWSPNPAPLQVNRKPCFSFKRSRNLDVAFCVFAITCSSSPSLTDIAASVIWNEVAFIGEPIPSVGQVLLKYLNWLRHLVCR